MKISVVSAVYNRQATIEDAIKSVTAQSSREHLEYITVDGLSNDGTADLIKDNAANIDISIREKDSGIYDALNKGIAAATGDIVGFLHADDLFADYQAVERIITKFEKGDFDAVYGDLTYVDFDDPSKIIRYWRSHDFNRRRFRFGWMPPHPTVYIRKEIYNQFGNYRTDLGSAADYECMIRLMYRHKIRVGYIPNVQVKMRVGGESNASIKNRLTANQSDKRAWLENDIEPPFGLRITKPLSKLSQYWARPRS